MQTAEVLTAQITSNFKFFIDNFYGESLWQLMLCRSCFVAFVFNFACFCYCSLCDLPFVFSFAQIISNYPNYF